jgi:excisionase family DNA binding protein
MEPLAVDVPGAARLLSVSSRTVIRLIKSGRLPASRIGRRIVVTVAAIKVLLEETSR